VEWLSDATVGPILGLLGTGATVTASLWYVVKFVHAFTKKLEVQDEKQREQIVRLEVSLARSQRRLGKALFLLDTNGITWIDPLPDERDAPDE
jgi:hypothetical protein